MGTRLVMIGKRVQLRQDLLKKLVFACAQAGSVEFDALLDRVLEQSDLVRIAKPSFSIGRKRGGSGEHNAL